MPCSTMRRHLAKLISEGFLIRRDSPNGKRYTRRIAGTKIAFGFDLSPMLHRAAEIAQAAESCRTEAVKRATLRQTISLLRRDLLALLDLAKLDHHDSLKLGQMADLAAATTKAMRRKLDADTLSRIEAALREAVDTMTRFVGYETMKPSSNDARNEQHQQNSNKESQDSESAQIPAATTELVNDNSKHHEYTVTEKALPTLPPLRLVLGTCTEIAIFDPEPIADWSDLVRAADKVRPMSGISEAVWHEAKSVLGIEQAATAFCAMLQRFSEIRNPGGYLRSLVARARQGTFSPMRMVMALQPKTT
ncbi:replication initiation protein RepC [Limimaricola soesokkakensis]|nr:replication initiation protein RepC [Limimaricola soesokkakensis]